MLNTIENCNPNIQAKFGLNRAQNPNINFMLAPVWNSVVVCPFLNMGKLSLTGYWRTEMVIANPAIPQIKYVMGPIFNM